MRFGHYSVVCIIIPMLISITVTSTLTDRRTQRRNVEDFDNFGMVPTQKIALFQNLNLVLGMGTNLSYLLWVN